MALLTSIRRAGSLPRRAAQALAAGRRDRRRLRRRHRKAEAAYASLRRSTGRPDLDAATSRRIRSDAAERLGSVDFAPYLRLYTLYRGRFLEGWIPEDFFNDRVLPGLYAGRQHIREKRTLSRRLLGTDAFPDVAYFVNGAWYTTDYAPIDRDELVERAFARCDEVYLKEEGSYQGRHVRRLGRADFAAAARSLRPNSVVQRPIVPHPWYDEVDPRAVGTLRLLTVFLDETAPRFLAGCMRIAHRGTRHVQSATMLKCMVTDAGGALAPHAIDESWRIHERHPDTGFVFAGARVPFYAEAVATCLRLHARVPHDPLVGWDLATTEAGEVEIMEWNSGSVGVTYSEAAAGPLFARYGWERFARDGRGGRR